MAAEVRMWDAVKATVAGTSIGLVLWLALFFAYPAAVTLLLVFVLPPSGAILFYRRRVRRLTQ